MSLSTEPVNSSIEHRLFAPARWRHSSVFRGGLGAFKPERPMHSSAKKHNAWSSACDRFYGWAGSRTRIAEGSL